MSRPIFRKEALARLGSPEQLDQLMPLTSPRGWLALAAIGLLMALGLLWAVFGTVTIRVPGQGVLVRPNGVRSVEAPWTGTSVHVAVRSGEAVEKGQELFRLVPPSGSSDTLRLTSPMAARVLDILVHEGEKVEKGTVVLRLEALDSPLVAILYLPLEDGYQVQTGMNARIAPAGARGTQFAVLEGQIKSSSFYPTSRPSLLRGLPGEEAAQNLLRSGPCLEIVVELLAEPQEQFEELYSGTPCRARIIIGNLRPVQLLFPSRRHQPRS